MKEAIKGILLGLAVFIAIPILAYLGMVIDICKHGEYKYEDEWTKEKKP